MARRWPLYGLFTSYSLAFDSTMSQDDRAGRCFLRPHEDYKNHHQPLHTPGRTASQMANRNKSQSQEPTNTDQAQEDIKSEGAHEGPGAHEAVAAPSASGRITVALVKKAVEDLEKAQRTTGYSKTDIVNRAISMYAFIEEEVHEGAEFLVRRKDGTQYLLKSY